jgi:Leucine-rich repeat (LRR) protein
MKYLSLGVVIISCGACSNYNVLLNDNALYRPPTLYLNFSVADSQLENCLVQHIEDGEIKSPRELIQVNCSYAGITNLDGLVQFSRIETLSLKGNPLKNIEPLFQMVNLRLLDVSESDLGCENISRLKDLPLDQVISSGNC